MSINHYTFYPPRWQTLKILALLSIFASTLFSMPAAGAEQPPVLVAAWGNESEVLKYPQSIATDAAGNAYVVDSNDNSIKKFDSNGNVLSQWGISATAGGQFNYPHDIATDADGNIYVADTYHHRIQKFDNNGHFLGTWGIRIDADEQFDSFALGADVGIATDASGNVYVADGNNDRIKIYTYQPLS